MVKLSNLLFPDGQHQTGRSDCVMFEIMWQVLTFRAVFELKENKAYLSRGITLYQLNEQSKMHKGEDLNCKVLSVMIRRLNILKYFSFGVVSLWT